MDNRLAKTLVFSGSAVVLIAFLLFSLGDVGHFFGYIAGVLRPIIIGCVMAFILNKPLGWVHTLFFKPTEKKMKDPKLKAKFTEKIVARRHSFTLVLALITVYVFFVGIIVGFCCLVIPQFIESFNLFSSNFDSYFENLERLTDRTIPLTNINLHDWFVEKDIKSVVFDKLNNLFEEIPRFLSSAFNVTASIIGVIIDIFLGFILSVYILAGKYKLKSGAVGLVTTFISPKISGKLMYISRIICDSYSTFFSVQLFDSFILGCLCFIGMTVFGFEYAPLISTIVGVTNIIPIVGPFIGSIPCAFILLMVDPIQAVWFVVFVVVIQQIDSNLIYPRVVGNSIGLPSLWVLVAVIIGGGLFGVAGILIAIPLFSIVYTFVSDELKKRKALAKQGDSDDA